jgi:hypothetical protein
VRWWTGRDNDERGTSDNVSVGQAAHDPEIAQNEQLVGTFVEVIGHVTDDSTIKLLRGLNLDSDKELGKLYPPRILPRL